MFIPLIIGTIIILLGGDTGEAALSIFCYFFGWYRGLLEKATFTE